MPYIAPSPLFNSRIRPQPASAGSSPPNVHHGRHKSEPSVSLAGHSCGPPLQKSSSYIYRHRRSTSNPQQTSNLGQLSIDPNSHRRSSSSSNTIPAAALWKSPSGAMILTGAMISPPDSKSNSSDDEGRATEGPKRNSQEDLKAAIMSLDQNSVQGQGPTRKGLGSNATSTSKHTPSPLDLSKALATETQSRLQKDGLGVAHPNSSEVVTHTPEDSDRGEDEIDLNTKPSMVRKKSGELVRPALRPKRRPCSAPGTPVFSKAVHFDSQLEHIRHFLQLDKPLAVSAGSSPVENYDGDSEFPFMDHDGPRQSKLIEWEARIANFPDGPGPEKDNARPIRAFNFTIHLGDVGNLESKRLFICIRYNVNGLEFWDNNNLMNYHIDFMKKPKGQNESKPGRGSSTSRPTGAIPRSKPPCPAVTRSKSVPPFPADSRSKPPTSSSGPNRQQHNISSVNLSPSRKDDDFPDPPPFRRNATAPQTFGHRYDFGASLSAAMQPGSAGQIRRDMTTFPANSISRNLSASITEDKPARSELFEPSAAAPPGVSQPRTSSHGLMRHSDFASGQPYHQSPMYKELVDKYCFYGSSKTGSQSSKHFSRKPHANAPEDGGATTIHTHSGAKSDLVSSLPPTPVSSRNASSEKPNNDYQRSPRYISPSRSRGTTERGSSPSSPPPPGFLTLPYHQSMQMTLSESPAPTFIRG
ncbi:protein phosphatase regulatory subunit Gac1 [Histoplasma capsulatum H143]|uniref:Protein phosphatase regulatory subunit Gac1 n=1 Tax=Ajellomyces capsulatus (strain H143) TaxID=544712 RepID=C6HK32_AJECH|nr:protein phosphatase regulatory subunit Gac1 [Histoplasma capsulatum H143]